MQTPQSLLVNGLVRPWWCCSIATRALLEPVWQQPKAGFRKQIWPFVKRILALPVVCCASHILGKLQPDRAVAIAAAMGGIAGMAAVCSKAGTTSRSGARNNITRILFGAVVGGYFGSHVALAGGLWTKMVPTVTPSCLVANSWAWLRGVQWRRFSDGTALCSFVNATTPEAALLQATFVDHVLYRLVYQWFYMGAAVFNGTYSVIAGPLTGLFTAASSFPASVHGASIPSCRGNIVHRVPLSCVCISRCKLCGVAGN